MLSQMGRFICQLMSLGTLIAIAPTAVGCGESRPGVGVATYPARGKVVLADGEPLRSGVVVFVSSGAKTPPVSGMLDAEGGFTLMTDGVVAGAPAGDYQVRVELDPDSSAVGTPSRKRGGKPFPARYAKETTSGLTATIKAEHVNDLAPFVLQ